MGGSFLTMPANWKNRTKLGYMAGGVEEHPLMRKYRLERENAPRTLFE